MGVKTKILIVAKTYPLPSAKYGELVCTGGVLEDGTFIRLYPVEYRYRPYAEWYSKYQWVEVELEKNLKDPRPETYRPVSKFRLLGEPLKKWEERRKFVLAKGASTMCGLASLPQNECSLGIIRPREVQDVLIERAARDWPPKWKRLFDQYDLFGPGRKPLEKIPYKFRYVFKCDEVSCKGHKMMIADWEVGALYRNVRNKCDDEDQAAAVVRNKLLHVLCASDRDTHFYVGTILRFNSWIVVGVFYPKK